MILKNMRKKDISVLEEYLKNTNINEYSMNQTVTIESVRKEISFKMSAKTPNQKKLIKAIDDSQITVCYGMAGTGKTYTAVQKALNLFQKGKINKIYLIKSVTALQGEELGFMKGTMKEKVEPFAYSFMHAFKKIVGESTVRKLEHLDIIEFIPIAFLRGVSIQPDAIVLVDEAQNISITSMRTIVTRIEKGCSLVMLGDTRQVDMKKGSQSSLKYFIEKFQDFDKADIEFIEFTAEDQMRNDLIIKLEARFEELEEEDPDMFTGKR